MYKEISNFLVRNRARFIIAVTVVMTIISLLNFYFLFEIAPQSNDECIWQPKFDKKNGFRIEFEFVKYEGVSWQAGIRDGDLLLEIDHSKIKNTMEAQILLNKFEVGDSVHYAVSRNGEIFNTHVRIKKLLNFQGIGFALLGFIWLVVGFIVVMAKPQGTTQLLFWRIGVLFTLVGLQSYFSVGVMQNPFVQNQWLNITIDFLWLLGATYVPFVLMHFFWTFPTNKLILNKKYTLAILYFTPTILLSLSLFYRYILFEQYSFNIFGLPFPHNILVFALNPTLIFIGMFAGLISLFRSYLKLKQREDRTAIFIILVSYLIGLIAVVYSTTLANLLAENPFNDPEFFMPIILVAIIPVAFAYSIFRYSLMDISDVIKNAILYGIATIAVAGAYFLIIYTLGQSISTIFGTEYQSILAAIIFIAFAIGFQSTKDRFQEIITRKFYPEQFAFQKVLVEFGSEVSSIVGLERILDNTVSTFVDSLKIKHFGIALSEGVKYKLQRSQGFINQGLEIFDEKGEIDKYFSAKISVRQQPALEKADFDKVLESEAEKLYNENIYTIIPLIVKSKIIGLVYFGLKHSGAQFSGNDLEILVASVNRVAVALENARLYLAEADKIKLDQEIENAKKIQESLLPNVIPGMKGLLLSGEMIPAMQIGGDYFDFIKLSDKKLFVVIGDVSGKGLSASFYMSKLQTMIKLFCNEGAKPSEILSKINKSIYNEIGKNYFITVTLAYFDLDKMEVRFCRAGHTPITLLRNKEVIEYTPKGIGLGLEKGDIFDKAIEEVSLKIECGDLLLLYSDGLTEAMDTSNSLYGEERLFTVLKENASEDNPKIVKDNIISSLNHFIDGNDHSDDITLALIKVT